MARRAWVLETSTKGTGANMVPLERVLQSPASTPTSIYVPPKREPRPEPAPAPRGPHRFKVVDVLTRQVLGEDLSTRETVDALRSVRSVVDVNVFVWDPSHERWRLLSTGEQRALWDLRAT